MRVGRLSNHGMRLTKRGSPRGARTPAKPVRASSLKRVSLISVGRTVGRVGNSKPRATDMLSSRQRKI
jgi:hypothetical protein